jgi:hypothetical protein
VTIKLDSKTKYKLPGVKDATLAILRVGERAAALVDAKDLALHVHLIPGKPVQAHRVGTVEKYEAGKSITLKDKKGDTSRFVVNKDTKIRFKKGVSEVKVGSRATVVARRDPASDQFTAATIQVSAVKPNGKPEGAGKPQAQATPTATTTPAAAAEGTPGRGRGR